MPEVTHDTLDKVRKKQFANIIAKLNDGKSLTAAEQKILDEYEDTLPPEGNANLLDESAVIRTADLVDFLGITAARISELAKDGVIVRKEHGRYLFHQSVKNYIAMLQKARTSKHGTGQTMQELRQRLIDEQGRKEAAIASLRELELRMKADSLIPESEAIETLMKLLTPLRRLLDALPRQIAAQANPNNPSIAELAIRNGLDERVFLEIEKIFPDE